MTGQIKSKERVRERGEVFTAEREVNDMLNLVKNTANKIDSTFLEPACGDGNFLIEILRRKLHTAFRLAGTNDAECERLATKAFSSIYGIDIMEDNVLEARERLYNDFFVKYVNRYKKQPTRICRDSIGFILSQNIQCGNTLSGKTMDGDDLTITKWAFDDSDGLTISFFNYMKMVATGGECQPEHTLPRIPYFMLPAIIK